MSSNVTVPKYAAESRIYTFDFSQEPEIVAGDTIASITSVSAYPSGLTLGTQTRAGSYITIEVSGGTPAISYTIYAVVTTLGGAVLDLPGTVYIMG